LICGFIDAMRAEGHGVESICEALREQGLTVAPRGYRAWKTLPAAERARSDAAVLDKLRQVRTGGPQGRPLPEVLYARRKMTAWLARNGFPEVSKHTVDRLMRDDGMNGLVRGRPARTTIPAKTGGKRAGDLLNRCFSSPRPNHAWVTDFTYVATWSGFVYVAFAVDLYSRAIVGWSASTCKDVTFVEACLNMALWRRDHTGRPVLPGMIHHSDAGSTPRSGSPKPLPCKGFRPRSALSATPTTTPPRRPCSGSTRTKPSLPAHHSGPARCAPWPTSRPSR
jgi:putative transposase